MMSVCLEKRGRELVGGKVDTQSSHRRDVQATSCLFVYAGLPFVARPKIKTPPDDVGGGSVEEMKKNDSGHLNDGIN